MQHQPRSFSESFRKRVHAHVKSLKMEKKHKKIENSKKNKTLLNRDTQVNQLIILTEQKQKHVIIIKKQNKNIHCSLDVFTTKKKKEGKIRRRRSLVCKHFV